MNICKKKISLPLFHLLFLEQWCCFVILVFFLKKIPWFLLKNKYYLLRLFFGSLGGLLWILGLKNTSVLFMVFTAFLGPFVSIVFSRLFLQESLGFYGLVALFWGTCSGISLSLVYTLTSSHYTSPLSWILGPLATLCFSLCSIFNKKLVTTFSELHLTALLALGSSIVYGVCLVVSLFITGESFFTTFLMPYSESWGFFYFLLLLGCHGGGNFFLLWSLKKANLSFLLPLGSFRLLFSSLLAYLFFQEKPSLGFYFSLLFMALGIFFLDKENKRKKLLQPLSS